MADLEVVTSAEPGRSGLAVWFTDRHGGVSRAPYDTANLADHVGDAPHAVRSNRDALAAQVGADVVWMEQPHGAEVAVVDGPADGPVAGVDGLVTTRTAVALAAVVADCVPVVLHDPGAAVVAVAHAGRRGMVSGVVVRTVETMTRLGADPRGLRVWFGPSVCGRCYEVPPALQSAADQAAPGCACSTRRGTPGIDLRAGLLGQLAATGVPADAVADVGVCTMESPDHFSHRRDGVTGRCAAVARLLPA